jgi:Protein of unknown function (DUF2752)
MHAGPQTVPPKIPGQTSPGLFAGIMLAAVMLGAGAVVFFFDPGRHGFYPVCLFHKLTGLNCPGCGTTRALYALLHGHLLLALHDNALFVFMLAVITIWGTRLLFRKMRNQPATPSVAPKYLWTFLAVAVVFGVLRNLPEFSFLSP